MEKMTIASSDFARKFGMFRQSRDVVFVTHHGRETHALVPNDIYLSMASGGARDEEHLPSVRELAEWMTVGLIVVRDDGSVVLANRVIHAMTNSPDGSLSGRLLLQALPKLRETLFDGYLTRTLSSGEACSFEYPSAYREERWLHVEMHPSAGTVTILVRDITNDVESVRRGNIKEALLGAVERHREIMYVRINGRGRMEALAPKLCSRLQIPADRLKGVAVENLVPMARRSAFRDVLEDVLDGKALIADFQTEFLCNGGTICAMNGVVRAIRGDHGVTGAVIVTTQDQ